MTARDFTKLKSVFYTFLVLQTCIVFPVFEVPWAITTAEAVKPGSQQEKEPPNSSSKKRNWSGFLVWCDGWHSFRTPK